METFTGLPTPHQKPALPKGSEGKTEKVKEKRFSGQNHSPSACKALSYNPLSIKNKKCIQIYPVWCFSLSSPPTPTIHATKTYLKGSWSYLKGSWSAPISYGVAPHPGLFVPFPLGLLVQTDPSNAHKTRCVPPQSVWRKKIGQGRIKGAP